MSVQIPSTLARRFQLAETPPSYPTDWLGAAEAWAEPPENLSFHQQLWGDAGREIPTGLSHVFLAQASLRPPAVQSSTVAVRDEDGVWRVHALHRMAGPDGAVSVFEMFTLPGSDGDFIDALLADPCLAAEPRQMPTSASNERWMIQTELDGRTSRFSGGNLAAGRVSQLYLLLTYPSIEDAR
jgi:hypothetical protein